MCVDRKIVSLLYLKRAFFHMSLLLNPITPEGRQAKDDYPHFSDWENEAAVNVLQRITGLASGIPETPPRTSDSKSRASSLLNPERRLY